MTQIAAYVARIATLSNCSSSCFVLAWRYLTQLEENDSKFCLNKLNIHRLVITSVMIASKFIDDKYFSNQYWARVRNFTSVYFHFYPSQLNFEKWSAGRRDF